MSMTEPAMSPLEVGLLENDHLAVRPGAVVLEVPRTYLPERRWIASVVFDHFLGIECLVREADRHDVCLQVAGDPTGRALHMPDGLFATPAGEWLTPRMLPDEPLERWNPREELGPRWKDTRILPIIFGPQSRAARVALSPTGMRLDIDVLGSMAFMLARLEEVAGGARDTHDRFPASSSLAVREGFLDRAIANDYLEILWAAMEQLWPGLQRRSWDYEPEVSHDVDFPLLSSGGARRAGLRRALGHAFWQRSAALALHGGRAALDRREGSFRKDPAYCFDFILATLEQHGLTGTFFMIAGNTAGEIDGDYSLDDPPARSLMRRAHERGHAIGLHPSYGTFGRPDLIQREFAALLAAAGRAGVTQSEWGSRQHYLRWEVPNTWQALSDAGISYDTTLGFADRPGFRSGTCYPYPVFNPRTRTALRLVERPLVVMDTTLLTYLGLDSESSLRIVSRLSNEARKHRGRFTLLWHNTNLMTPRAKRLFRRVVEVVS